MRDLILSIFPGIGILDKGFEEEGFTILRGPDPIWGGDIRNFHSPAGIFEGVIGGPPCQLFTQMRKFNPNVGKKFGNLIPEFERVVTEAGPEWFIMENIKEAPIPEVPGYQVDARVYNNRWLGEVQNRVHMFSFGTRDGHRLVWEEFLWMSREKENRLLASDGRRSLKGSYMKHLGRSTADALRLQGLPPAYLDHCPFTKAKAVEVLGNAVPLPMARALARAVKRANSRKQEGGITA